MLPTVDTDALFLFKPKQRVEMNAIILIYNRPQYSVLQCCAMFEFNKQKSVGLKATEDMPQSLGMTGTWATPPSL